MKAPYLALLNRALMAACLSTLPAVYAQSSKPDFKGTG